MNKPTTCPQPAGSHCNLLAAELGAVGSVLV